MFVEIEAGAPERERTVAWSGKTSVMLNGDAKVRVQRGPCLAVRAFVSYERETHLAARVYIVRFCPLN